MQHLFTHDAKLTTLERTTVHTRRAVLARLEKGLQQLKQMGETGEGQRFQVRVGEVEPSADGLLSVVLLVRQGLLRLSIRALFVVVVDDGRCRIKVLEFCRS